MAELGALRRGLVASMLAAALATMERAALAESDGVIAQAVAAEAQSILPSDDVAGAAVALQLDGSTHLFTYGWADSTRDRRVTPDTLFNLASVSKVFDATLLALAIKQGEVGLDDPVAQYVTELRGGGDIQRVTLG